MENQTTEKVGSGSFAAIAPFVRRRSAPLLLACLGVTTVAASWAVVHSGITFAEEKASPTTEAFVYQDTKPGGESLDVFLQPPGAPAPVGIASSKFDEYSPSLSPDGEQIAFVRNDQGDADIFLASVDGSAERRITTGPATDGGPTWSPDGKEITFWRDSGNGLPEVFIVGVNGENERRLTSNLNVDVHPSWSPDGTSIAITRLLKGGSQIFILDVATGTERQVTQVGAFTHPQWSPDGSLLVAGRSTDGESSWDIVSISVDSGNVAPIRADVGSLITSLAWRDEGIVTTASNSDLAELETLVIEPQTGETLGTFEFEGEPSW